MTLYDITFALIISYVNILLPVKVMVTASRLQFVSFYDYNIHVEGLLPVNLCLITSLRSVNVRNLKDSACNSVKW